MAEQTDETTIDELKTMVGDYARQETLEPLKRLGDWAKFGFVGAILLSMGAFLIGLGVLRVVQQMEWTEGNWSFVPYAILFVLLLVGAASCFYAMTKRPDWLEESNE